MSKIRLGRETIELPLSVIQAAISGDKVFGYTHDFYKYPARFSPQFARAVIGSLSSSGDTIMDPFVGGGTSAVEASIQGRRFIGVDINALATFVSKIKTTRFSRKELHNIEQWAEKLNEYTHRSAWRTMTDDTLYRNVPWWIRDVLASIVQSADDLLTAKEARFVRCVSLRLGQWALDCRYEIPRTQEAREKFRILLSQMLIGAEEFGSALKSLGNEMFSPLFLNRSVVGIEKQVSLLKSLLPVRLVVTSPPYPGVHVLYHRWQIRGRKETGAPFSIAGVPDGHGPSHFMFGDRRHKGLRNYFSGIEHAFRSIKPLLDRKALVVQLVSFSQPSWQKSQYLKTMETAGYQPVSLIVEGKPLQSIARAVPNRKWYAYTSSNVHSGNEHLLIHTPKS